ncbi:MAG: DNA topoisomerase VI subunit B [Phycisphaerae bacterium]|nr:DNA topoisomerase VI subunit B [Phycisphaerae bacterium]
MLAEEPPSLQDEQKAPPSGEKRGRKPSGRRTAEEMARQQREISVSEFFAKNRHLLGFDNKRKALLTTVKEAVDNSLDACEEAGILPELLVRLKQVDEERFKVTVRDNGPGIVKTQIPNIFGKLLYGSKFHRLKMSRGQQGIGISAAGMYGLLTTGKAIRIISRTGPGKDAHRYDIQIDTKRNKPEIVQEETVEIDWPHGTEVTIELLGSYTKGRTSVDEYIEQTAIANPHATINYEPPIGDKMDFPRGTEHTPPETREIKPHPYGIELGMLMKMIKDTKAKQLGGFLQSEFSRVSPKASNEISSKAGLTPRTWLANINGPEVERIYRAIQETKLMAPRTDCLAPIGTKALLAGLLKGVKAEFFTATTRPPGVYRGNPFQIEVGLAFGGNLPGDQLAKVIRFANRVPLLYQQSHCSIFKSVLETHWRAYGLQQSGGALPTSPLIIMVHMASVWVPFTSESKEAIADYDEIRKEVKLALQECGRKLNTYIRRRARQKREGERRNIFERYIPEVVAAVRAITRVNTDQLRRDLLATARSITEEADVELDEDGKPIQREPEPRMRAENTIVIDPDQDEAPVPQLLIESVVEPEAGPVAKPARSPKKRTRGRKR